MKTITRCGNNRVVSFTEPLAPGEKVGTRPLTLNEQQLVQNEHTMQHGGGGSMGGGETANAMPQMNFAGQGETAKVASGGGETPNGMPTMNFDKPVKKKQAVINIAQGEAAMPMPSTA